MLLRLLRLTPTPPAPVLSSLRHYSAPPKRTPLSSTPLLPKAKTRISTSKTTKQKVNSLTKQTNPQDPTKPVKKRTRQNSTASKRSSREITPPSLAISPFSRGYPLLTDPKTGTPLTGIIEVVIRGAADPKTERPPSESQDPSKQKAAPADVLDEYEKRLSRNIIDPSNIPIGFKDIHLKPSTIQTIDAYITYPILHPELFSRGILSRENATGILLFGPPGTGKTMLAKAVAKESSCAFMNVRMGDVLHKYYGEAEKHIQAIFSLARKNAPMVIFLDEVDSLLRMRGGALGDKQGERVVNEFMSAWDGLESQKKGIIVMGATNRPFDLDDAALRRFPKRILVDLPTERGREEIIRLHLRDDTLDPEIDLKELAQRTENWSGSDLKNLCLTAAMYAVRETIDGGYVERKNKILSSQCEERNRPAAEAISRGEEQEFDPTMAEGNYSGHERMQSDNAMTGDEAFDANSTSNSDDFPENELLSPVLRLKGHHFDLAFSETSCSISDEMGSVTALRKWDSQYGGTTLGKKRTTKIGFGEEGSKSSPDKAKTQVIAQPRVAENVA